MGSLMLHFVHLCGDRLREVLSADYMMYEDSHVSLVIESSIGEEWRITIRFFEGHNGDHAVIFSASDPYYISYGDPKFMDKLISKVAREANLALCYYPYV